MDIIGSLINTCMIKMDESAREVDSSNLLASISKQDLEFEHIIKRHSSLYIEHSNDDILQPAYLRNSGGNNAN